MEPGCRNVDLISSVTHERRHLVIEKWESPDSQRRHFDSAMMVEMASGAPGCWAVHPRSTCGRRPAPTICAEFAGDGGKDQCQERVTMAKTQR